MPLCQLALLSVCLHRLNRLINMRVTVRAYLGTPIYEVRIASAEIHPKGRYSELFHMTRLMVLTIYMRLQVTSRISRIRHEDLNRLLRTNQITCLDLPAECTLADWRPEPQEALDWKTYLYGNPCSRDIENHA